MIVFDKAEVRKSLNTTDIFNLLQDWGGDPEYTSFGIVSSTICHNPPGEGSRKLYYYENSDLFRCYTGCDSFDIFELTIKVASIQWNRHFDLNDAVRWIAQRFGISGTQEEFDENDLEDWKYLANYERIQEIEIKINNVVLKEYDKNYLDKFNYNVRIGPWLDEGISQEILEKAQIGYYPGGDQITIPHYDQNNRFIGLRGRTLCKEEAERYGKYRPIKLGKSLMFNHPLGFNLYNLNNSKDNIKRMRKAIVFESEKSCLKYQTYFGVENDITVACCGSSLSSYQVQLLMDAGAEEIVIAFDRQFQKIGDDEFNRLKKNLLKIRNKYKNFVTISFIFDRKMITDYKASPIDCSKEKFLILYKERIIL